MVKTCIRILLLEVTIVKSVRHSMPRSPHLGRWNLRVAIKKMSFRSVYSKELQAHVFRSAKLGVNGRDDIMGRRVVEGNAL